MTHELEPHEILAELFYRAKGADLDPVLWRVHERRMPQLARDLCRTLNSYSALGVSERTGKREIFGIPVYLERDRQRLPPPRRAREGESEVMEAAPNYYCLECLEPTRGRTVYREWIDGKFV